MITYLGHPAEAARAINIIEKQVGAKNLAAVIIEPIQGEGGINAADVEWLRALRKRCDEVGAVLIYDEIQVSQHFGFYSPAKGDIVGARASKGDGCSFGGQLSVHG